MNITYSPANTSNSNISALQTLGGAGNFLLNGSTAGTLDLARKITFTSAGNISAVTMTITGTDADGRAATETMAGPNGNTVTSTKFYKVITTIAANGAVATNTSIGTSNQFASQILPLNHYRRVPHTVDVECTGTITFTLQETFDDIRAGEAALWQNVPGLTGVVVTTSVPSAINSQGTLNCTATRVVSNSYSSGATLKLMIFQSAGTEDD